MMRTYSEAGLFVALQEMKVKKMEMIDILIHTLCHYVKFNVQVNAYAVVCTLDCLSGLIAGT